MKYSIVIPCYNEEENLSYLINSLDILIKRKDTEIILVENGSSDNSKNLLKKMQKQNNIKVVYIKSNKGYGYGLLRGLAVATGTYVGWIHADLQISIAELIKFIDYIETTSKDEYYFLKGRRTNRSLLDYFFTFSMTCVATLIFRKYMYDIGAVPVLFHQELLKSLTIPPYDFSIELYVYYIAKIKNFKIKRIPITQNMRLKGKSSWNKGFKSKLLQSYRIFKDILKIKKGEQIV